MSERLGSAYPLADDQQVLRAAHDWLTAEHAVVLVTVVRTWGSSPRPPGALLAINDAGQTVGSVSGGCIEDTLRDRFCNGEIAGPDPTMIDFGIDREDAGRLGLPCGGRLELLVEHLHAPQPLERLLDRLERGELVARRVCLNTGEVSLHSGEPGVEFQVSDDYVVRTLGPSWTLLLVGNGQLAQHLGAMALQLGFEVTICDPRESFASLPAVPTVHYDKRMPDDAVRHVVTHPRAAVVTLAHDPRQDDLALTAALESPAFYIGALGSTRSAMSRNRRLQSLGYSASQLARIHGPAGLPIGSKRPAEIALSILAQITAIKNTGERPATTSSQANG